ncbi:Hemicentin-1 [Mytilus edulis]|uniref:Hemicentin-1 n=1 Tax=Mytilus edulis TaxID=6550 RepID=A0A8S3TAF0_MYTED|nr:Hemicentin-1 [Mytilus edulis]
MENIAVAYEIELFITTTRTSTVSVQVTAPKYSSSINEQFTVTAGSVKQLFFSPSLRMSGSSSSSKGILVSASDEVVIYGVNKERFSNDAFLGVPTDVLGTEYYAVTWYPASQQCELAVAGVIDNTVVSFTFPASMSSSVTYDGVSYSGGSTLTVTIHQFDSIQLINSNADLTGTYIHSDKKIAAFSGNKKTIIGTGTSSDHLVEQLTPVGTWGKNFITVPIPLRTTGDYFKYIASEAGTTVTISGGFTETLTLANAGDFEERLVPSTAYCYVSADKAIKVVQFCLSQQSSNELSDPMMMIIPPVEQFGADYTFATPMYSQGSYDNYFMFVVKKSEKDGLLVDGGAFPSATIYNDINVGGTEYVAGYISVSDGSHTIRHQSTISIFGGYLYGQAQYETYGFTTGMRLAPINTVCVPTANVIGDGYDNDCDGLIDEEICNNGADDDGDGVDDEDCAKPSPIDGNWAAWTAYGACSVTCNPSGTNTNGQQVRTRNCSDPGPQWGGLQCILYKSHPQYGGQDCQGSDSDSQTCTLSMCPIDGNYTDWSAWSVCTVSCGGGTQDRTRSCTNPVQQYGGNDCSQIGSDYEQEACNTQVCIIDGAWSQWGNFGQCSVTCGGGQYTRSRTCSDPYPQNGGLSCSGDSSEFTNCNTQACPTASSGQYVQLCPSGWFTCATGSSNCIEDGFKCDCMDDCGDASDETENYAGCSPQHLAVCTAKSASTRKFLSCALHFGVLDISSPLFNVKLRNYNRLEREFRKLFGSRLFVEQ